MAKKLFGQFLGTKYKGPVALNAKVTVAGSGAPTLVTSGGYSKGIASIARTGTGAYTLTLADTYAKLLDYSVKFLKADGLPDVNAATAKADSVSSAKTLTLLTLGAATPTATGTVDISAVTGTTTLTRAEQILTGGLVGAPTTASTQITGAGATNWNVNIGAGAFYINSVAENVEASADYAIHDTTQLVANGESCVAAVVAVESGGAISYSSVTGTPATTGSEAAPSDGDIDTAVGHSNWLRLCNATINRTGDTTVTQSEAPVLASFALPTAGTVIGGTATTAITPALASTEGVATDPASGTTMYISLLLDTYKN